MGLLLSQPAVSTNTRGFVVSFSYLFQSAEINNYNVNGMVVLGEQYSLNLGTVQGSLNLPPMRSLRLTQLFLPTSDTGTFDGSLLVSNPSDGSVNCFGYQNPTNPFATATILAPYPSVTAIIPVDVQRGGVLNFTKMQDGGQTASPAPSCFGLLWASLYSYDLPPFAVLGSGNYSGTGI
jgi:hypothetical protein